MYIKGWSMEWFKYDVYFTDHSWVRQFIAKTSLFIAGIELVWKKFVLDKMMRTHWLTWARSWGLTNVSLCTLILSADNIFLGSHQWMCSSIGEAGYDAEKRA